MEDFVARRAISLLLIAGQASFAAADTNDAFEFFREEAQVVSASRQPVNRTEAPATVYIVTQDDLRNSGAQTLWDALRSIPGVDVVQTTTGQGEVSIRGLDKPATNRTLVLLDGKTVMDPFSDFIVWESIPVTLQEIDRIEVVEGPSSALYGANAVNGVINIITKTPDQMRGTRVSYAAGERNAQIGSMDYGRRSGPLAYRFGGGWDSTNQFADADQFASQSGKFNASIHYGSGTESEWTLAGGLTDFNTRISDGPVGTFYQKGITSFTRMDYRHQKTRVWGFWNHSRNTYDEFAALGGTASLDSDMLNMEAEQAVSLPYRNDLVIGANARRNMARSTELTPGLTTIDTWSFYTEDKWTVTDQWSLTGSGRFDHHPYAPDTFSPRGSLLYVPVLEQVFRLSAGSSFRNPTLLENSITTTVVTPNAGGEVPNPPYASITTHTVGNTALDPERMQTLEIAHNGRFGPLQTTLTGFYYKLTQIIVASTPETVGTTPPTLQTETSYANSGGVRAWGGEAGATLRFNATASAFANYSYQDLRDLLGEQLLSPQSPRHKANTGVALKRDGWAGNVWLNWVDKTKWVNTLEAPTASDMTPVNAYFLVNAHVHYAWKGDWEGLEVGVTAFNLLNHDHYEIAPQTSPTQTGQSGEIVRSRWTGTVSYHFQ